MELFEENLIYMHLVSPKTKLIPYYILPDFQKKVPILKYSYKLLHQIYCIHLLKYWLTEQIFHQIYTG